MKFSVITVSYNSAATITDTLVSVGSQKHAELEHIVIDGGSSDATLAIVKAHGKRVSYAISEPDRGIYDAMNKGICVATGDVVGFLNSDDFYPNADVLSKVADAFADPAIQACWGDLCYVRQDNPKKIARYWKSSVFTPNAFARSWCPPHPTFFVRRNLLDHKGAFDLRYKIAADMELMARLIEVQGISCHYIPSVLVHMRLGGTTNRNLKNIFAQNMEIWAALHQHHLAPSMFQFFFNKFVSRLRQFLTRPAT